LPSVSEYQIGDSPVYVAQRLYAIAERGDRLIAATAATLDLPQITRDPQIAAAAGVECLWA
jgi:predicted nucleic acid-binding protein